MVYLTQIRERVEEDIQSNYQKFGEDYTQTVGMIILAYLVNATDKRKRECATSFELAAIISIGNLEREIEETTGYPVRFAKTKSLSDFVLKADKFDLREIRKYANHLQKSSYQNPNT
jgi:hypothetical protein